MELHHLLSLGRHQALEFDLRVISDRYCHLQHINRHADESQFMLWDLMAAVRVAAQEVLIGLHGNTSLPVCVADHVYIGAGLHEPTHRTELFHDFVCSMGFESFQITQAVQTGPSNLRSFARHAEGASISPLLWVVGFWALLKPLPTSCSSTTAGFRLEIANHC
eukprot:5142995-Amphidinium_carterae.1